MGLMKDSRKTMRLIYGMTTEDVSAMTLAGRFPCHLAIRNGEIQSTNLSDAEDCNGSMEFSGKESWSGTSNQGSQLTAV